MFIWYKFKPTMRKCEKTRQRKYEENFCLMDLTDRRFFKWHVSLMKKTHPKQTPLLFLKTPHYGEKEKKNFFPTSSTTQKEKFHFKQVILRIFRCKKYSRTRERNKKIEGKCENVRRTKIYFCEIFPAFRRKEKL